MCKKQSTYHSVFKVQGSSFQVGVVQVSHLLFRLDAPDGLSRLSHSGFLSSFEQCGHPACSSDLTPPMVPSGVVLSRLLHLGSVFFFSLSSVGIPLAPSFITLRNTHWTISRATYFQIFHLNTSYTFPSPIIAILTAYPQPLPVFIYSKWMSTRPITWHTAPKGKDLLK